MEMNLSSALSEAVINGDEIRVGQLLAEDVDVNSKVGGPLTCINLAVEKGHLSIIERLLANGADVNARFPIEEGVYDGSTLLYRAASKGYDAVVELLFQYGADVNAKNSDDSTSLHIAAEKGFLNVVKILIERGANVNVKHRLDSKIDYYQRNFFENRILRQCLNTDEVNVSNLSVYKGEFTPLHVAVKRKHLEIVKLLLESGADVNAPDENDDSALSLAVLSRCLQTFELVLNYAPDKKNFSNKRALVYAVKHNNETHRSMLRKLMDYGIIYDDDIADFEEFFEEIAVQNDHFFLVRELLTSSLPGSGLDVRAHASSALIVSAEKGNLEEVQFLLDLGADANAEGFFLNGQPLLIAVKKSNLELARLLIARGANVNETPGLLIEAAKIGSLEMIKLLLSNGGDVNESSPGDLFSLCDYLGKYKPFSSKSRSNFRLSPLFVAASRGFDDAVKHLLENNADVYFKSENGLTPLLIAVVGGHSEVTEILLKSGASVNSIDQDKRTALYIAAELGHRDVVNALLRFGAKVDKTVTDPAAAETLTPLLVAAKEGHLSVVETLLQFGVSVTFSSGGMTALCHAAGNGHDAIVEILLKHGANVNHKQLDGRTALHDAASFHYMKTVKILLECGANVNAYDSDGNDPLQEVLESNSDEIAQLLIKYGAEFTGENIYEEKKFHSAIQRGDLKTLDAFFKRVSKIDHAAFLTKDVISVAVEYGHLEVAKLLSNNGVKFNSDEERGESFLTSVRKGFSDISKFLLQHHGADVNFADCHGKTALHFAAERGDYDAVKLLLENEANANAVTDGGDTPLILSAKTDCLNVVDTLIKAGAALTNADRCGKTALFFAAQFCHADVMKLLLNHGAVINCLTENRETPLLVAVRKGHFTILEPLMKFGADLRVTNEDGLTALHFAAEYGDVNAVKLLLENGACVNSIANNGQTPLFLSAGRGRFESVELLLQSGADVNINDLNGFTALNSAAERGYIEVVKLLLERGINVCCKSRNDFPLLFVVAVKGHLNVVDMLMEFGSPLEVTTNFDASSDPLGSLRNWRNPETLTHLLENGPADIKVISEGTLNALIRIIRDFYWSLDENGRNEMKSKSHRLATILECFYLKMKLANFFADTYIDVERPFDYRRTRINFETKCVEEVEKMKSEFIRNSNFSVFDILTKSLHRLASLARNQSIMLFLMSTNFSVDFPLYHKIVRNQFKKAVLRRKLLDQSMKLFCSSQIVFSSLPLDVIERILLFLGNWDLRILALSFNTGNSCNSNIAINSQLHP